MTKFRDRLRAAFIVAGILGCSVLSVLADSFDDATNKFATVQSVGTSGMTWTMGIAFALIVLAVITALVAIARRRR